MILEGWFISCLISSKRQKKLAIFYSVIFNKVDLHNNLLAATSMAYRLLDKTNTEGPPHVLLLLLDLLPAAALALPPGAAAQERHQNLQQEDRRAERFNLRLY